MKSAGLIAKTFVSSRLTVLFVISALVLGACALIGLPREEEPQISVPFMDVFIPFEGATAKETEKRIVEPFERKIWEIPGVEYVYSTAQHDGALIVARFTVGSDEAQSLVKLYTKVFANLDMLPQGAGQPLIKPKSIYDVPVLALTFTGADGGVALRRVAARVQEEVNAVRDVSETTLIGGHRRTLHVRFDPRALAESGLSVQTLEALIAGANVRAGAGHITKGETIIEAGAGGAIESADDLKKLVVGVRNGLPLSLGQVAEISDTGDDREADACVVRAGEKGCASAVTLTVAKRKGTNAVSIVEGVMRTVESLKKSGTIPANVKIYVSRDYGHTSKQKADELLFHMFLATVSVTLLVGFALGWREAAVVFVAIPVTLALTLFIYFALGYTLNRITLFALIFSVGILVDDAIVVVENINRRCRGKHGDDLTDTAVEAVDEVGNPTILATFAVIASILPMAFVHGLMGPYMRPIPVGASAAMLFSLAIAFIVSPWLFTAILRRFPPKEKSHTGKETCDIGDALYRCFMTALLESGKVRGIFFVVVGFLFAGAIAMFAGKAVVVKMLPFDNKNEIQLVLNMPAGTSFDQTMVVAREAADAAVKEPEVEQATVYVGTSAPFNFNGLVRHYYLRGKPWQADVMVVLHDRHHRKAQSHDVAKRLRAKIAPLMTARGARLTVAEVPPGPPVLSPLVAEVYGNDAERAKLSADVLRTFETTVGVGDVDIYADAPYERRETVVDTAKASLNGITAADVAHTAQTAMAGRTVALARTADEPEAVDVRLRMQKTFRDEPSGLSKVTMFNRAERSVSMGMISTTQSLTQDGVIYHKNLLPVTYVVGDAVGRLESPPYAVFTMMPKVPAVSVKWDGEWQITVEVFRDLGIAFALVLVLIYMLVVGWFKSFTVPLVIMAPIPLTLVGIAPGHWLTGTFFSATSMIGMIAGAGIVVRNSIILVDFIEQRLREGESLEQAVVDAGATRFRPMLLTAAAVMLGSSVMLSDPIFKGLAVSLMFGEIASTLLSRNMVPVLYFLLKRSR